MRLNTTKTETKYETADSRKVKYYSLCKQIKNETTKSKKKKKRIQKQPTSNAKQTKNETESNNYYTLHQTRHESRKRKTVLPRSTLCFRLVREYAFGIFVFK